MALIANADRHESRANETVLDFAQHYCTSFLPARPYHPQDKGKVESAVQVVERWILIRLHHQHFATVDEVNEAIAPLLEQLRKRCKVPDYHPLRASVVLKRLHAVTRIHAAHRCHWRCIEADHFATRRADLKHPRA